jgi:hypothetical protein
VGKGAFACKCTACTFDFTPEKLSEIDKFASDTGLNL